MSRVRFPFRSTPSQPVVPTQPALTSDQKKEAANSSYWDTVYAEDPLGRDVERLWGIENFGNTCYCNSVLQALYACQPFRQFVESYPRILPPSTPLAPPPGASNQPIAPSTTPVPPSPSIGKKENPFDLVPQSPPPGGEKRSWKSLGRKNTNTSPAPSLAVVQQQVVKEKPFIPPPSNYPALPEPNPDQPPPNVFETIQTLFRHLSFSAPHQPLPSRKDPKKEGETAQTASLLAPTPASPPPPAANGTNGDKPVAPNNVMKAADPPGPPLLASLPPPSAPRGGGPFGGGSLGRGVVRPEDVLKTVKRENEMFRGMAQQDAHEFLGWVLNKVAEEVEPLDKVLKSEGKMQSKGGKTFVQNLFEGSLTNETRCLSCETTSSRDEIFMDLSIDIEQHTSVTSCLRGFSASEMLCQKNKFYCDSCCGLQEAEKRMKINRLPNILALHLKRFKYQEALGRYTKLFYRVPFPLQLRLPNTSDDAQDPDRLYELFAVVVHIGNGPHHGHYVCIVRSHGRWVMCDDENVEPIEETDIFRYFGDYPSGAGYVLFYQAADLNLEALGLAAPQPPPPPAARAQTQPEALIDIDEEPVQPATKSALRLDIPPERSASPVMSSPAQLTTPTHSSVTSVPIANGSLSRKRPDSTTYAGLGVTVPNDPPPTSQSMAPSSTQTSAKDSASSSLGRRPSQRATSGSSYSGGSGLGRKLSGMSTKSLMSRSGSLMKLGLGKKDKKLDEE